MSPEKTATPSVNDNTLPSSVGDSSRPFRTPAKNMVKGATRPRPAAERETLLRESTRLSVRNWRTMRARVAPDGKPKRYFPASVGSAASSRLATLMHAIASTTIAAPSSRNNCCAKSLLFANTPVRASCSTSLWSSACLRNSGERESWIAAFDYPPEENIYFGLGLA